MGKHCITVCWEDCRGEPFKKEIDNEIEALTFYDNRILAGCRNPKIELPQTENIVIDLLGRLNGF